MDLVDQLNTYLQARSVMAFVIAFIGGIFASLTPCVYPMIPVTIAYIGGRSGNSRWQGFTLSLSYVVGLSLVYAILGAIAAFTGQAFGDMAQTPLVYIIVGAVFIIFGLSMVNVIIIRVPGFLSRLQGKKVGSGFLGAFVIGAVAGLVASPCLTPILGALLLFVAQKQNIVFGTSLLLTFGLGIGMLFILLGTFAGLLTSLPKSGKWMEWVKKGFAFLLLFCAAYFFFLAGKMSVGTGFVPDVSSHAPADPGTNIPPGSTSTSMQGKTLLKLNQAAPMFSLKDHKNNVVNLSDFKGKVLLLDFWATWCKPCWKAIPSLKKIQDKYKDKGFTIIGILMDKNAAMYVPRIYKKTGLNYPLLVGTPDVEKSYKPPGYPTLVLIDRQLVVRKIYIGGKDKKTIEKNITELLEKK